MSEIYATYPSYSGTTTEPLSPRTRDAIDERHRRINTAIFDLQDSMARVQAVGNLKMTPGFLPQDVSIVTEPVCRKLVESDDRHDTAISEVKTTLSEIKRVGEENQALLHAIMAKLGLSLGQDSSIKDSEVK